jgi:hypothetical protein
MTLVNYTDVVHALSYRFGAGAALAARRKPKQKN